MSTKDTKEFLVKTIKELKAARVRITGLITILVERANPNGDPHNGGYPRRDSKGKGVISAASFKGHWRNNIHHKENAVWEELFKDKKEEEFLIFENEENKENFASCVKKEGTEKALRKYLHVRLFGTTGLEKEKDNFTRSGCIKISDGSSLAPIEYFIMGNTRKRDNNNDKKVYVDDTVKVVEHAVYTIPFSINTSRNHTKNKKGEVLEIATAEDIQMFLDSLEYVYSENHSEARKDVHIIDIKALAHTKSLGNCSDFKIQRAMIPVIVDEELKQGNVESSSIEQYQVPTWEKVAEKIGPVFSQLEVVKDYSF